jgi:ATP-dependent Zn protease
MAVPFSLPGFAVAKAHLAYRCPTHPSLEPRLIAAFRRNAAAASAAAEGDAVEADPVSRLSDAAAPDTSLTLGVCEELALILCLTSAVAAQKLLVGEFTELRISDAEMIPALATLLTESKPVLEMLFNSRPPDQPALFDMAEAQANEPIRDKRLSELTNALRRGKTGFVVTTVDSQIDDRTRARLNRTLHLPAPTRQQLCALVSLLHPDLPLPDANSLPSDDDLRRLPLFDVMQAVLHAPQTCLAGSLSAQVRDLLSAGGPTLSDVKGHDAVRAELQQLAGDIQSWSTEDLDWSDIPNGHLFHGSPGTGKTLLARAFAGSAGLPIVVTSYGEASASEKGNLSVTLKRLFDAADEARRKAPAVLFIDEIDAFGSRDLPHDHNSTYRRGLITGFLRLIDTVRECPGVVLIGATNDLKALDAAARRPGRFDRVIRIGLPGKADILDLLRADLPMASETDLLCEAEHLIGGSPAEICSLLRQAATAARANHRDITVADLRQSREAAFPEINGYDLWRVAIHEAGHLLVGHKLGLALPDRLVVSLRGSSVALQIPDVFTPDTLAASLAAIMGGRAAERVILRTMSSGSGGLSTSDLASATQLAFQAEVGLHLDTDSDLIWHDTSEMDRVLALDRDIRNRVSGRLKAAEAEAIRTLQKHQDQLIRIAKVCIEARELDRAALAKLLRDPGETDVSRSTQPADRSADKINLPEDHVIGKDII